LWIEVEIADLKKEIEQLALNYQTNENFRNKIDKLIDSKKAFSDLVNTIRQNGEILGISR
jgi:hypothetical protein